jgi:hypothetical protein
MIASLIISFISMNFTESAHLANLQPACSAIFIGSKGAERFPSGVVFVFAQIGVVGLACPVVRA